MEKTEHKILMVISEKGYTWDEVVYPYKEFSQQCYAVEIATPNGYLPNPDPLSLIHRPVLNLFGFGTNKHMDPRSVYGKALMELLKNPRSLKSAGTQECSGLYVAGGHGALFDLNKNTHLHRLILDFDQANKPIGLLCHSVSTLAFIERNGYSFLQGRSVTGFPTVWEKGILAFHYVHQDFLPIPIWTGRELDRCATGRKFWMRIREVCDPTFAIRDGNLVTGVGPKAGKRVARIMLGIIKS